MAIVDPSTHPLAELVSLSGRAAVVTGGARGIGYAISGRLAEAGASVLVADVDEKLAMYSADEIAERYGTKALGYGVDVASPAAVRDLADRAVAEFGGIDVWVNNAGIYPSASLLDMTDEQ